ncbi:D-alanyl-D-alanine carboxypeptidase/D-alanyl-D-alanine-endopeptidase [Micropruina sp.]|uniref:D-alanyl-D-alanine carboxypeptidase/D-alanyl-D-alanine endopeptidase n=1 Tax=Micropruina sp. TaxID=2737536 RepID=UPI0039E4CCFE
MTRHPRLLFTPLVLLPVLALLLTPAAAPAAADPLVRPAASDAALATKVASVLSDSRVKKATVGVVVTESSSGTPLYRRSATTAISPASNMKLVTAAAALDLLGPDHTFSTEVYSPAAPVDGVVSKLYLKGNGDPTLRERDLKALAAQVKAAGITQVSGGVVGDGSFFDSDKYNNYWDPADYNNAYAAQVTGLTLSPSSSYSVGTVQVTYQPGSGKGKKAKLGLVPARAAGYVKLVNKTTTTAAGSGASISVRRTSGTNTITVSGRVALKRSLVKRTVTISNPTRYAAHVFTRVLRASGVTVLASPTTGSTPATRVQVASDSSVPLSTIVTLLMKPSNNGMTEHLAKTLGRVNGKAGTWKAGAATMRTWLAGTQTVPSNVVLVDGSGLAHRNKLTARVLVRLLQYAQTRSWFDVFYASLPVAGNADPAIGGTLADRMVGTAAQNNLRAKTGTLSGITALSGYVTDRSGRRYTFSMLGTYSGSSPRIVFDKLGATLAGWSS